MVLKEAIGDAWCPQTLFSSPISPHIQRQLLSGREWTRGGLVGGRRRAIAKARAVRAGFSESVGTKVGEASGSCSSQVGESNPVLQMKRLPRTGRLLEAYLGRPGDSASELSFLSQM